MDAATLKSNLRRLLDAMAQQGAPPPAPSAEKRRLAKRLARQTPLSHSTSAAGFGRIVQEGCLWSLKEQVATGQKTLPSPLPCEYELGTEDSIFLFVGPFSCAPRRRRPQQWCGFLWETRLEHAKGVRGEASPFDSGGLVGSFQRPDPAESPRAFLDRHRLPLGQHRRYLEAKLLCLFGDPEYYITAPQDDSTIADPVVGLTGGDRRRWTHEVRVSTRLALLPHLLAVFVPRRTAYEHSDVVDRLRTQNVKVIPYLSEDGDFPLMVEVCRDFLRNLPELSS